jgi:ribonuclease R
MGLVCCQIVKRGRYVAAEPYFEGGTLISLSNAKQYAHAEGQLAIVAATRSVGRVLELIGSEDNLRGVLRGLLAERGAYGEVPPPGMEVGSPSRAELAELDAIGDDVPHGDMRADMRGEICVTIDPPDARDHDDAIGLVRTGSGWQLWVHIADVAAFVPAGSALDLAALDRAMSTYVPGLVAPMLPHRLSSDLCSLRPGVDRGCVSVCLDLEADGSVVSTRFARTLIRSARRLSYEQVDALLAHGTPIAPVVDEMLTNLDQLTGSIRARRMARGALDMAMREVRWELGERTVHGARLEPESASHRLVEECMLLANEAVGDRLAKAQAPGLWRVHDYPDAVAVDNLVATMERLGIPTPAVPEVMGGRDAARIAGECARLVHQFVLARRRGAHAFPPRVLRALQQARYAETPGVHSGLATSNYAHFTSPIRRYPDLINHRSLLALLGASQEPASMIDTAVVAEHVSFVERESITIERDADNIAAAHLLHRHTYVDGAGGEQSDGSWRGEVVGFIRSGAFIRFGDVYDGFLPARTISGDERYELDEHGLALEGVSSGHRIRLGDPINVYVERINRAAGRIELRMVGSTGTSGGRGPTHRSGTPRSRSGTPRGSGGNAGRGRPQRRGRR